MRIVEPLHKENAFAEPEFDHIALFIFIDPLAAGISEKIIKGSQTFGGEKIFPFL